MPKDCLTENGFIERDKLADVLSDLGLVTDPDQ